MARLRTVSVAFLIVGELQTEGHRALAAAKFTFIGVVATPILLSLFPATGVYRQSDELSLSLSRVIDGRTRACLNVRATYQRHADREVRLVASSPRAPRASEDKRRGLIRQGSGSALAGRRVHSRPESGASCRGMGVDACFRAHAGRCVPRHVLAPVFCLPEPSGPNISPPLCFSLPSPLAVPRVRARSVTRACVRVHARIHFPCVR